MEHGILLKCTEVRRKRRRRWPSWDKRSSYSNGIYIPRTNAAAYTLCRVATAGGQPWLWWVYTLDVGAVLQHDQSDDHGHVIGYIYIYTEAVPGRVFPRLKKRRRHPAAHQETGQTGQRYSVMYIYRTHKCFNNGLDLYGKRRGES